MIHGKRAINSFSAVSAWLARDYHRAVFAMPVAADAALRPESIQVTEREKILSRRDPSGIPAPPYKKNAFQSDRQICNCRQVSSNVANMSATMLEHMGATRAHGDRKAPSRDSRPVMYAYTSRRLVPSLPWQIILKCKHVRLRQFLKIQ
jgi:hypothetical protein